MDKRLTYSVHVHTKKKELDLPLRNISWLLCRKSKLSSIISDYFISLFCVQFGLNALPIWGCTCNFLRNIIQRYQKKRLRLIEIIHYINLPLIRLFNPCQLVMKGVSKPTIIYWPFLSLSIRKLPHYYPVELPALNV